MRSLLSTYGVALLVLQMYGNEASEFVSNTNPFQSSMSASICKQPRLVNNIHAFLDFSGDRSANAISKLDNFLEVMNGKRDQKPDPNLNLDPQLKQALDDIDLAVKKRTTIQNKFSAMARDFEFQLTRYKLAGTKLRAFEKRIAKDDKILGEFLDTVETALEKL